MADPGSFSLVIPIYRNRDSLERLLDVLVGLGAQLAEEPDIGLVLEVVFVVDGSPDDSFDFLAKRAPSLPFRSVLVGHSRNFGSFAAIRTGLGAASGTYFGVMAADLQEPPSLIVDFARLLATGECDIAVGRRRHRHDPLLARTSGRVFWGLYRRLISPEMPDGGVDVFACNRAFRDNLLELGESRSSLVGLAFWLGFRRREVPYDRLERLEGRSAWTWGKKVHYMLDSIFAFTDYPVRFLLAIGAVGTVLSLVVGATVAAARLLHLITVPGYTALMLVALTYGALNLLALGAVGEYAWRAYENTKGRPQAVVARTLVNRGPRDRPTTAVAATPGEGTTR